MTFFISKAKSTVFLKFRQNSSILKEPYQMSKRSFSGRLLAKKRDYKVTKKNENKIIQDNKHIHIPNNILIKVHIIPCIRKFYSFVVMITKP